MLLEHVGEQDIVSLDDLRDDPLQALEEDHSIEVVWVDRKLLGEDCSIAAAYDSTRTPARISVANDESSGRRAFSLMHEYGHHLRNQVRPVLMELIGARRRSAALEERMCDAFASLVLIPAQVREEAFLRGVTASAVAGVMSTSTASKQAVAVAAAESMSSPGYVMLVDEGHVTFAARSGGVFPIRRGAEQGPLLNQIAERGGRGVARLEHGWGTSTAELNVDAAVIGGTRVVVAVDGPVPWASFSAGRETWARAAAGVCSSCTREFSTMATPCATCSEHKCPHCGACECAGKVIPDARVCDRCFLTLPPSSFAGSSATCDDCC